MEPLALAVTGVALLGTLLILSAPAFYILGHKNGRAWERYVSQRTEKEVV